MIVVWEVELAFAQSRAERPVVQFQMPVASTRSAKVLGKARPLAFCRGRVAPRAMDPPCDVRMSAGVYIMDNIRPEQFDALLAAFVLKHMTEPTTEVHTTLLVARATRLI